MKKTLAILACTVLAASLAGAEEVVSSNTVGYTKLALTSKFTMTGAQFKLVGETNADLALSNIELKGVTGIDEDWNLGAALLLWNGSSYVGGQYYWVGEAMQGDIPCKWCDPDYESADEVVLPAGTGFWIQDDTLTSTSSASILISGEVVAKNEPAPAEIKTPFTMISNPYPISYKLKDLIVTGTLTGVDEDWNLGAAILVWNGSSYVGGQYYWVGETMQEDIPCKWCDPDYESADDIEIPVGGAFWIQDDNVSGSAATISFPAP